MFGATVQSCDSTQVTLNPIKIYESNIDIEDPTTLTPTNLPNETIATWKRSSLPQGKWYIYGQGKPIPSYVGYREPTINFWAKPTNSTNPPPITDSHCYYRCSSSGSWSTEGRFCVSQTVPLTLDPDIPTVVERFSWCPAPNPQNPLSPNPAISGYAAGQYEIGDAHSEVNNVHSNEEREVNPRDPFRICLSACPEGFYVTNTPPYDKCVSRCPLNSGFQNELNRCI